MCWAATCYLQLRWWKEAITMEIFKLRAVKKKKKISVHLLSIGFLRFYWLLNKYKRKRSFTQWGKLQTGLGEILKPGGTEPPAQEGAERQQIQQGQGKSEFLCQEQRQPLQDCSSQVMSLPWDAQQRGRAVFFLFQIHFNVSDHPWNAHTELQKIRFDYITQNHQLSPALQKQGQVELHHSWWMFIWHWISQT